MAYEPKTWQCDDTITADELNRMEQGIAEASQGDGATLVVNATVREATAEECANGGEVMALDRTWQEIYDAFPYVWMNLGKTPSEKDYRPLSKIISEPNDNFYSVSFDGTASYDASAPNEYPLVVSCEE